MNAASAPTTGAPGDGSPVAGIPTLEVQGVSKRYGQVQALAEVSLTVDAGEIVALVGDNGAGKSTLVKALAGVHSIDQGQILIDGRRVAFHGPTDATAAGIEAIYQDLALCDNLDVTANLFLGRERRRGRAPFLDHEGMEAEARALVRELAATIADPSVPVSALSGGQRQTVAVGRAALWGSRVVLLDEPTAALGVAQTEMVYRLVRRLAERGMAVLLISHNMADVFALAHRIVVLRLGRNAGVFQPSMATPDEVVRAITGSSLTPQENS